MDEDRNTTGLIVAGSQTGATQRLRAELCVTLSVLHLNDQTCKGQMDVLTKRVTFSFNSMCGTVVTANSGRMLFKNAIKFQSSSDIITRQDQFYIDFSCLYNQDQDIRTMPSRIRDSSVIQQIVSGAWNYTLTMKVYTDAGHTRAVAPSTIWVELDTDGLEGGLVNVVTDSCWATNQQSPNGSLSYNLIMNSCANPADQTVKVQRNRLGASSYFSSTCSGSPGALVNNSCAPVHLSPEHPTHIHS